MQEIGADGEIAGTYRKSHIPDGPGYEEKYYFRPGNDGFKVWDVPGEDGAIARVGVGIWTIIGAGAVVFLAGLLGLVGRPRPSVAT